MKAASPNRRRRGDLAVAGVGVTYVLVAVTLATVLVWPVYQTQRLVLVAGVGAGLGIGLGLAARRFRWNGWATALVAVVVYAAVSVPVAVPYRAASPAAALQGVSEALAGVVVGWRQLLTLRLPVADYRASLAPWLAATLVACLVATLLAVRADRRAALAVPVLGALAGLAAVLAPVTPSPTWRLGPLQVPDVQFTGPGAALVAVTVVWLVSRARLRRARALAAGSGTGTGRRVRRAGLAAVVPVAAGAVLCTLALVAAVLVTPAVSSASDRSTVRDGVEPVLAVQAEPSPLDGYRAAFAGSAATTELFTVQVSGRPVDRLRIAVLDAYDGQHFTTSTSGDDRRFLRLPRTGRGGASQTTVTMGDLATGIWMPVPVGIVGAPVFTGPRADRLAGAFYVSPWASAALDVATTGVGQTGLRPGDGYRVRSSAPPVGRLGAPADTALISGESYPQMVAWVKAQGRPRTAEGFAELVDRLRARGYLSHWLDAADAAAWTEAEAPGFAFVAAYAGHSTLRVESLFTQLNDQEQAVGASASASDLVAAVGDGEQFATAVALLARYLGYESRVVLGVRLTSSDPTLPTCDAVCTGADLAAWVEVRSAGGSWVTFDVDPQTADPPQPVVQGEEPPSNPTQVREPYLDVVQPPDTAQDSNTQADANDDDSAQEPAGWVRVARTVGLSLGLAVFALIPFLVVVPAVKGLRRRRRRRAAVPEVAAVGAWAELSDRCLDLGVPLVGPTRREAASASGRPGVSALATLVDTAVFGSVPATATVSDDAWAIIERDLAEVRDSRSAKERVWAWLRPRSILHALTSSGSSGSRGAKSTTSAREKESPR
ncbi:MAG: transglutaminase-like domain-containing protein [Micrococcales bacterium]|nr:transglutaminase-like domain-containing protein [Micrococcales bacterium]